MTQPPLIDPEHKTIRGKLRKAGPAVLVAGAIFMLVGFVDFFSAFGGDSPPTLFWCFFVGMPLIFFGGVLTSAAYAGRVSRYMSQETTPVMTDTFNYAARETKDGVREIAGAIGEGLRGTGRTTAPAEVRIRCAKCNTENDADAKFCDNCGEALAKTRTCPACNELNDPDARFCDNCGREL